MDKLALIVSVLISIATALAAMRIMIAASHMPRRRSRVFVSLLTAVATFAAGYWLMRLAGVRSVASVDSGIRLAHGLLTCCAMWESSLLLRVWARSPRADGVDIVDSLTQGDEVALARMAVQQIAQPAWARHVDDSGHLGRVIAANDQARQRWQITGPPTETGAKSNDDTRKLCALTNGAHIFIGDPVTYHIHGAR